MERNLPIISYSSRFVVGDGDASMEVDAVSLPSVDSITERHDSTGAVREWFLITKHCVEQNKHVFTARYLAPTQKRATTTWVFAMDQCALELFTPIDPTMNADGDDTNIGAESDPHWIASRQNTSSADVKSVARFYKRSIELYTPSNAALSFAMQTAKSAGKFVNTPPPIGNKKNRRTPTVNDFETYYWQQHAPANKPFLLFVSAEEVARAQNEPYQRSTHRLIEWFTAQLNRTQGLFASLEQLDQLINHHVQFGLLQIAHACTSPETCQANAHAAGFACAQGVAPVICEPLRERAPLATHMLDALGQYDVVIVYGAHDSEVQAVAHQISQLRSHTASIQLWSDVANVLLGDMHWNYWTRRTDPATMQEQLMLLKNICMSIADDLNLSLNAVLGTSRLSLAKASVQKILRSGRFLPAHIRVSRNERSPDKRQRSELEVDDLVATGMQEDAAVDYQGGKVLDVRSGLYFDDTLEFDFDSHYPAIIAEFHLFYPGLVPDDTQRLGDLCSMQMANWIKMKRLYKQMGDEARVKALKLEMNAFYGCLGHRDTEITNIQLASDITARGREQLQSVVTHVVASSIDHNAPLMGHTDAVLVERLAISSEKICEDLNYNRRYIRLTQRCQFKCSWVINKTTHLSSKLPVNELATQLVQLFEQLAAMPSRTLVYHRFLDTIGQWIRHPGFIQRSEPPAVNMYNLIAHLAIFIWVHLPALEAESWVSHMTPLLDRVLGLNHNGRIWFHFVENKQRFQQVYLPVVRSLTKGRYDPAPVEMLDDANSTTTVIVRSGAVNVSDWKTHVLATVQRHLRSIWTANRYLERFKLDDIERMIRTLIGCAPLTPPSQPLAEVPVSSATPNSGDTTGNAWSVQWFSDLLHAPVQPTFNALILELGSANSRIGWSHSPDSVRRDVYLKFDTWLSTHLTAFMVAKNIVRDDPNYEQFAQLFCTHIIAQSRQDDKQAITATSWEHLHVMRSAMTTHLSDTHALWREIEQRLVVFFWN